MSLSQVIRRKVHQRAGGCCEYCYLSKDEVTIPFHIDHFIPLKHEGKDDTANLCLACLIAICIKAMTLQALNLIQDSLHLYSILVRISD